MGRRALGKIDPAVDLSQHLHEVDALETPLRPARLFSRDAPLEIEVGSGKGLFLESASARVPGHNFLGVEVARKYARYAAARLARGALGNARVLHGDAQRLFAERLPAECAVAVHIYFPDPWWKKRHHKRRIMNPSFVTAVERVLVPGGELHFWTDVEAYFQASLAVLSEHTRLEGPCPVDSRPPAHDLDYRTHFERRMRLQGQSVYRARFRKGAA